MDTTGAGDAFNAGLIDELLAGGGPLSCLQHACACGTISTGAAGGLGALPTREQARELTLGEKELCHVKLRFWVGAG